MSTWCWWREAVNGEPCGYPSRHVGAEVQDGDGDSVKDTVRRLAAELGVRQKAAAAIDLKVKGLRYDGHVVQRHTS